MNSRRNFLGKLFAALTLFPLAKFSSLAAPTTRIATYRMKATVCNLNELMEDLSMYHDIDPEKELRALLANHVEREIPGSKLLSWKTSPAPDSSALWDRYYLDVRVEEPC